MIVEIITNCDGLVWKGDLDITFQPRRNVTYQLEIPNGLTFRVLCVKAGKVPLFRIV